MKFRFCLFQVFLTCWCIVCFAPAEAEWQKLVRGSVALYCHDGDMRYGERVISIIQENLSQIAGDLGLSSFGEVKVIIATSEEEFNTLTGQQIPEWGVAATDPEQAAIFLKSPYLSRPETDLRKVIIHELSHVVMGMALQKKQADRWFDEGFAQYEAEEKEIKGTILLTRSLLTGNIIWLNEVDSVLTFRREKAALAYQVSYTAVQYLADTYGEDAIVKMIQSLRSGKDMDEALFLTIGIEFEDFQDQWYHTIKSKYLWYIFLDFPFLVSVGFVVLFFTALFVTRRRVHKKKLMWDIEESYDY
ncbi:peptidase MA family metallohydrolase [bacterium]|nr:peptidase MA family metallohydrolase [bacterium]